jgi:HlyD family secretion protein
MRKGAVVCVSIVVFAAVGFWGIGGPFTQDNPGTKSKYRVEKIQTRDLVSHVSATGTLIPVVTVTVGSEVSGQIMELTADFNSQVRKGDIIARLDPESYQALVRESEAELALAEAKLLTQRAMVERSQADLENIRAKLISARAQTAKAEANYQNADRELERSRTLLNKGIVSKSLFDAAQTSVAESRALTEQAKAEEEAASKQVVSGRAGLSIALAQVKEAEAQIDLKKAALDKRRADLDNTIIRSPVDGVVVDRSVDVGQTVAASLQAPTLFTIAQDLRRMQVTASIDEADIGRIREGQPALFTVDAFGDRSFSGSVAQIRKAGKTVQNVVTYTVVISADNPDLFLMPGMTANVEIEIFKIPGALVVPDAALRFKPADAGQGDGKSATASTGAEARSSPQGRRGDPEAGLRKLTEALDLTKEQQGMIRTVFQEARRERASAPRPDEGSEEMGTFRDKIRKQIQQDIKKVLTPEQRTLYERFSGETETKRLQRGILWRLDDKSRPVPIPIIIGATDGSSTEVAGEGIASGMEVIVGTW